MVQINMTFGWKHCLLWVAAILSMLVALASAIGCAKIIDPNDRRITIDNKKYPHLVKKYLNSKKKPIHTLLTEQQYYTTQQQEFEPLKSGFWDKNDTGIYHWVVCDINLFSSKDKVTHQEPTSDTAMFTKDLGNISYEGTRYGAETDPDIKYIWWDNCKSWIGEWHNVTHEEDLAFYEVQSSSMWFTPDPNEGRGITFWRMDPTLENMENLTYTDEHVIS